MKTKYSLVVLILAILAGGSVHADLTFGRFYTTPNQRDRLDAARSRQPQEMIVAPVAEEALPQAFAEDIPQSDSSITLDGIVYRSDGKNTAWINRSSTNEGNVATQFTKVGEKDVDSNHVRITLPDNQTRIELKVGEQYDINSKQIHDNMKDPVILREPTPTGSSRPSR